MDNNKVMIVGTGNVGASIAFALLNQRTAINEIVLTDDYAPIDTLMPMENYD